MKAGFGPQQTEASGRAARGRRGQALVEFAMILPLLLLLFMILVDFGRAIFAYNSLANAARSGARVAIVNQVEATVVTRVADAATGLELNRSTGQTCLSGANGVCVQFVDRPDASSRTGTTTDAVVRAWYEFSPITPVIGRVIGPIKLDSATQLPIERVCSSGC